MLRCKKAAIGETMTWIVATLIILFVLTIFIYASGAMGMIKSVSSGEVEVEGMDLLETKTSIALSINSTNENKITTWISEAEEYE